MEQGVVIIAGKLYGWIADVRAVRKGCETGIENRQYGVEGAAVSCDSDGSADCGAVGMPGVDEIVETAATGQVVLLIVPIGWAHALR